MNGWEPVSLSAMLQHPSWRGVLLLAGHAERVPRVAGSVVVRDPTRPPPDVRGRLLVSLGPADRAEWRLDSLLSRSHRTGAVALLLDGHEPLRRSTQLLAERLAMPVLGAEDPLAAHEAVLRLVAEPQLLAAQLVLQTVAAGRREEADIDSLLQLFSQALGRPVALFSSRGDTSAGPIGLTEQERAEAAQRLTVAARNPAPQRLDLRTGVVLVAHPVAASGVPSWLVVQLPEMLPVEADAVACAAAVASTWIEQRLALNRLTLERSARRRTSLLGEMLQGDIRGGTRRRALDMGWQLEGWHTGIRIGVAHDVDVAGRRDDVVAAFEAEDLSPVVVEQGDGWSAWTTADVEPTAEEVQHLAAQVRRVQRRLAKSLDPYVGMGRVHPGPDGIGRSLGEAGDAARLARSRAETGRFLHVDRLGLAQLLLAWTRTDTFQPAAKALLAPLQAQPGDLVHTLSTYLDAESSLAETAAILGVHRNTVAARVARIREILGVDLDEPDERLALHLACRTETST